jgi:hypothetical protein
VTLDQPPHHRGLACRAKRRADFLGLLDLDQPVDDVAARHQQAVNLLVDAVDLLAQYFERGRSGGRVRHLQNLAKISSPHPLRNDGFAVIARGAAAWPRLEG